MLPPRIAVLAIMMIAGVAHADPAAALRAHQLSQEAAAAARRGDCVRVRQLETDVARVDESVYTSAFRTDAAIAVCFPPSWYRAAEAHASSLAMTTRAGIVIGGSLGLGAGGQAEGRLGWMVTPWLAAFANVIAGSSNSDDGDSFSVIGGGVRLYSNNALFVDGSVGLARSKLFGIDEDDVRHYRDFGWALGLGAETAALLPVGFELGLHFTNAGHGSALVLAVGATLY